MVSKATWWRLSKDDPSAGWLKGHHVRGSRNVNFNNGQYINKSGYRRIRKPEHPNSTKTGWILEHRFVMSEHLGRPLLQSEVVHHINEDKLDNRIENLEITTASKHRYMHDPNENRRVTLIPKVCIVCGSEYILDTVRKSNHKRSKYCSRKCVLSPGEHKMKVPKEIRDSVRAFVGSRKENATAHGLKESDVKRIRKGIARVY